MKFVKLLLISFIITSCAPIYVTHDFEKGTDFTKYKTYRFYDAMETGLSPLDTKRLLPIMESQLEAKGYTYAEAPDFYINIQSQEYQEERRNTVGVGVGGSGRNLGGGVSVGIPIGQAKVTRQIIFEFIDKDGIGLFWQAVTESSIHPNATPEKREEALQAIVVKALKKYPPELK